MAEMVENMRRAYGERINALTWMSPETKVAAREKLQELVSEGVLGGLTANFFSFIGYNMDPERFERTVAAGIADAVAQQEGADLALLAAA